MAYTKQYAPHWAAKADKGELDELKLKEELGSLLKLPDFKVPEFGRETREKLFSLDPSITYLTNGSYGVTPKPIREIQRYYQDRCDVNPVSWFEREQQKIVTYAALKIAQIINAPSPSCIGFVANATAATNAIFRSMKFQPGDVILTASISYPAVLADLQHLKDYYSIELEVVTIQFPVPSPDYIIEQIRNALDKDTNKRIKLAVFDHISSGCAMILPVKEIVSLCKERAIPVCIDGAHVPGHIHVDMADIDADWYAGNLHKWYWVPAGCGFLYTSLRKQSETHPAIVSYAYGHGYTAEFLWQGSIDYTHVASVPAAIRFHELFGIENVINHNHELLCWAANHLIDRWKTYAVIPLSMCGNMASIALPRQYNSQEAEALRDVLLYVYHIQVPSFMVGNITVVRISANIFNEKSEYEALASAILDIIDKYPNGLIDQVKIPKPYLNFSGQNFE